MNWILRFNVFFLLLLIPVALSAQQKKSSEKFITWQECLRQAQQHSLLAHAEQSQTIVAQQKVLLKKAQAIPKIEGVAGSEGRILGGYHFGQEWALVQADWSLGDFFVKTDKVARQNVVISKYRQKQQQLQAMGNAAILYVAVLQTQKALQLFHYQLNLLRKHKLITYSMWKAGLRTKLDVLQTETQLSIFREDSLKLITENENLRQTLALKIGWTSGDSLRVTPFHNFKIPVLSSTADNKILVNRNIRIKIYQAEIDASRLQTKNVVAKRYPHFTLGGGWFADGDPTGDGNYWLLQAGIRIPIYEGNSIKILETASVAQKEALQFQMQNAQRDTFIKITTLMKKMNRLRETMDLQQQQIQTLKQSNDFAEVNFKAGLITNLEYLDVQQKLIDARLNLEQSRLQYVMNLIDFLVVTNQEEKLMTLGK